MLGQWWAVVVDSGPTLIQHWSNISCSLWHTLSKHETLAQYCSNVGPPSTWSAQQQNNNWLASRVCWALPGQTVWTPDAPVNHVEAASRLRRRPNIKPTLGQRLVFAGQFPGVRCSQTGTPLPYTQPQTTVIVMASGLVLRGWLHTCSSHLLHASSNGPYSVYYLFK